MNAREVVLAQYAWEEREAARAARVAAIEAGGETLIELADTEEADVMATVEADEVARFLAAVKDARQHGLDKSAALAYAVLESKSEVLSRSVAIVDAIARYNAEVGRVGLAQAAEARQQLVRAVYRETVRHF